MSNNISVDIFIEEEYAGIYLDGVLLIEGKHLDTETAYRIFQALPMFTTPRSHYYEDGALDGAGFPRNIDDLPDEVRNANG